MQTAGWRSFSLALAGLIVGCAAAPPPAGAPSVSPPIASASASSAPAATSAPAASSASPVVVASAVVAPEIPGPERLLQALKPAAQGEAVLLLGVHLERVEGYNPMFSSEGKPRTDVRPGYRTLVVRTRGGGAEILGDLPFVAIPQGDGFVFIGEASVSVHLPPDPRVTLYDGSPRPRDYDATALWQTTSAAKIKPSQEKLRADLRRKQAWGVENTEQIIYASRRALCTNHTESEVTGGALYFRASSLRSFSGVGPARVDKNLFAHLDERTFRAFGARLLEIREDEIELDRPFLHNSFDMLVWRDDVAACFDHTDGALQLTGSVRISANSARSFSRSALVGPAPAALAPGHDEVDIKAVRAVIPGAIDAFASPARDVLLVLKEEKEKPLTLVVWDVLGKRQVTSMPFTGRPILDEWATGETAGRWLNELSPHASRRLR